tara:strand:+ start:2988 stop:4250 length:1263 start_codon:yes stop_codon:yes gene_type:complete
MVYFSSLQYFLYALFPLMTIALVGSISCGEKEELDKMSLAQSPYVLPSQDPSYASDRIPEMFLERVYPKFKIPKIVDFDYVQGDRDKVFLVNQSGEIIQLRIDSDGDLYESFLDISERVNSIGMEEGLLGLVFAPDYDYTGQFYVYYTALSPRRSVISRFTIDKDTGVADPTSEETILEIPQPFPNHNGGALAFGPEGYLYVGIGDGGSGGDPSGHGQNTATLLGTIVRIDVKSQGLKGMYAIPDDNPFAGNDFTARQEIWAYGLRNPWRFSFDQQSDTLWVGDVGQNRYEEVNIIEPGLNYGWNQMEGSDCFISDPCSEPHLILPIIEYSHNDGCSITGGHVYRGSRLPFLEGFYIYGDFCSGKIWALSYEEGSVVSNTEIVDSNIQIASFGRDLDGEIYVLAYEGGIYRLYANKSLVP